MENWTDIFARHARQLQVTPQKQTWQSLHQRLQRRRQRTRMLKPWSWAAAIFVVISSAAIIRIFTVQNPGAVRLIGELEPWNEAENYFVNARPAGVASPEDPQATLMPNKDPQRQETFARIMAELDHNPEITPPIPVKKGHYQVDDFLPGDAHTREILEITQTTELNLQIVYHGEPRNFLRIPGQPNLYVQQAPQYGLLILEVVSGQQLVLKQYDEQKKQFFEWHYRLAGAS